MKLENYFVPLKPHSVDYERDEQMPSLGQSVVAYWQGFSFPSLEGMRLALLGADAKAADAIRRHLYGLALPAADFKCADLGNLVLGHSAEDTRFALTEIAADLLERGVAVVVLGGGNELAWALYKAYEELGRIINVAAVDARFDIEESPTPDARSWLYHVVLQQPNFLFNFANLAHQGYLCGTRLLGLMEQLQFDTVRLGDLQGGAMEAAEPLLRWSDMVSVDLCAVRGSDAPAARRVSPHGLYGEQLCQLMRFAGLSDKVSSLGLFELEAGRDADGRTAALAAQALWHFAEGFFARMGDDPRADREHYRRFLVPLAGGQDITFYKSKKSDRWWMEVPGGQGDGGERYRRHLLIPCTYDDYQQALRNEPPPRWMRVFQRVN